MKKILITGITGFAGSHLAELLVQDNNTEVVGIHATDRNLDNVSAIKDKIHLEKINLLDLDQITNFVNQTRPDVIFHLAAAANPGDSFKNAADFIANNSTSQINLLEAVKESKLLEAKIMVISSAYVYGLVSENNLPINEQVPFNPDSPYSVSKITQDYLGLSYYNSYKLRIVRLRPFNHIGPRLSTGLAVSRFAKQIVEIEKGVQAPVMTVGNLEAKRDFTDVRDMVKAYVLAAEKCIPGEAYNIGSGVSHRIGDVLESLLQFSKVKIEVKTDQNLLRPSDIPELRCDATKFRQATGWEPEIKLEKTLQDILDYWRNIV
ncbi:GDP-mannose 4,6-dehydratase [Candidatus Roizmanbacteria bacterium]|nr:GDP-mannose 4,6-dehydratase [Candidatus Roizmanbacteria bacterium]